MYLCAVTLTAVCPVAVVVYTQHFTSRHWGILPLVSSRRKVGRWVSLVSVVTLIAWFLGISLAICSLLARHLRLWSAYSLMRCGELRQFIGCAYLLSAFLCHFYSLCSWCCLLLCVSLSWWLTYAQKYTHTHIYIYCICLYCIG